ncbi:hypothetical protein ANCCEY_11653 [Ancylostoma ceylanicum]|uniref:SCP domain-containing protein n=1 Tax=Ancylostoma ceylanicum TaxID=53326 RepID=A0A0D6LBJ5_9BILA|nr:hypothetical protein ANCCEY_11653 [Ancylostoma ceylanicum]
MGYKEKGSMGIASMLDTPKIWGNPISLRSILKKAIHGIYENREGYPVIGPAKNMYALSWDCELERKAQQSVASCSLEQGPGGEDGRNMMALSGSPSLSDDLYTQIAVLNWVSPVKFFGKNDPTNEYEERFCPFANPAFERLARLAPGGELASRHLTPSPPSPSPDS